MIHEFQRHGLCSTCIHVPTCSTLCRATRPIHHCELFECEPPDQVRMARSNPVRKVHKSSGGETAPKGLKGLCVNCECRSDCCLSRPEGGVWHCEEYR